MKNLATNFIIDKDNENQDFNRIKEEIRERRMILLKKAFKFYKQNSLHIEIQREDKELEKTYFYLPAFCSSLDKDQKKKFNVEAVRISVKSKQNSLQKESETLIRKMKLSYQLQCYLDQVKVLSVIVQSIPLLQDIAFILAIVINILILIGFD